LEVSRTGSGDCRLEFSPSVSPRAQIAGAEIDGRRVPFEMQENDTDQHVTVEFPVKTGTSTLRIRLRDDFGLSVSPELPPLGSASQGLRVMAESWTPRRDSLSLDVSGARGRQYEIGVWNPSQVTAVEGAELVRAGAETAQIKVRIPSDASEPYARERITIHFTGTRR
jgi:hypothetical protein